MTRRASWLPPGQTGGWILIEDVGPWSMFASEQSSAVQPATRTAARVGNFRINLIRPHVGSRRRLRDWLTARPAEEHPPRRARPRPARGFLATAHPGGGFLEEFDATELGRDVSHLLESASRGAPTGVGVPRTEPIYLACSNGKRNADCARRGRRTAAHLLDLVPARSWETTHVSGCSGAANVVVLPSGIHYRQVTAEAAVEIVSATERGRIALPWYHGCSAHRVDVQIADLAVRNDTGLDRIDDIRPLTTAGPASGDVRWVELDTAIGPCRVTLRRPASGSWRQWDVVSIDQTDGPRYEFHEDSRRREERSRTDRGQIEDALRKIVSK